MIENSNNLHLSRYKKHVSDVEADLKKAEQKAKAATSASAKSV